MATEDAVKETATDIEREFRKQYLVYKIPSFCDVQLFYDSSF
jgi:hypothetical protein